MHQSSSAGTNDECIRRISAYIFALQWHTQCMGAINAKTEFVLYANAARFSIDGRRRSDSHGIYVRAYTTHLLSQKQNKIKFIGLHFIPCSLSSAKICNGKILLSTPNVIVIIHRIERWRCRQSIPEHINTGIENEKYRVKYWLTN